MGLDPTTRGVVEQIIDDHIKTIPRYVQEFRAIKPALQIKEESDFVYGMIWGQIVSNVTVHYMYTLKRQPSPEEMKEASDIILKRSREIRDAIFNAG